MYYARHFSKCFTCIDSLNPTHWGVPLSFLLINKSVEAQLWESYPQSTSLRSACRYVADSVCSKTFHHHASPVKFLSNSCPGKSNFFWKIGCFFIFAQYVPNDCPDFLLRWNKEENQSQICGSNVMTLWVSISLI